LFDVQDFREGDFGQFVAVGGEFRDFGGHFDQFFGERGDQAKSASQFFGGFQPGGFRGADTGALLEQIQQMDFQCFQELGKDVAFELLQDGLSGNEFQLTGD
jgi:hypothetical protein